MKMVGTVEQIDAIFNARSIAIFGVSSRGMKQGNLLFQAFLDMKYDGKLIPVHPAAPEIMGIKAYPNLKAYGNPIDYAIISLHPSKVFDTIKDCIEIGKVKGISVFSSSFGEQGAKGQQLEQEIVQYARAHGSRIIGPNCMGLFAPSTNLSFFPGLPSGTGEIGYISQSGSLAVHVAFMSALKGIHYSKMISCGNCADLTVTDFLEYLGRDPETKIISCYIEGIKDANRFIRVAKEISKKKPIIVWKVGDTPGGQRAAQSHTASISGDADLWDKAFEQAGILRVYNLNELLGHLSAFLGPYLPKGPNVAIISGPGGPAVSSADACEKVGLPMALLKSSTKQQLAEVLPEFGTSVNNPVDLSLAVAFDTGLTSRAAIIAGKDPNVDSLLLYVSTLQKPVLKGLLKAQEQIKKPMVLITCIDPVASFDGAESIRSLFNPVRPKRIPKTLLNLNKHGISTHLTEQDAAKALLALWKYQQYLQKS